MNALSDPRRETEVLLHEEQREPGGPKTHERLAHFLDEHRGEPFRTLVEEAERWLAHQGAPDGQPLLFAAGVLIPALPLAPSEARHALDDPRPVPAAPGRSAAERQGR